jgi:hypothetical protein
MRRFKYKGQIFKITKSPRKNKQLMVESPDGKKVHFGDPAEADHVDKVCVCLNVRFSI